MNRFNKDKEIFKFSQLTFCYSTVLRLNEFYLSYLGYLGMDNMKPKKKKNRRKEEIKDKGKRKGMYW